ncbi:MAG: class I SAM-dependent methyltransferase [Oligoflexia bacterium]|nr:class I SAM-dependent methyltransferase [Oligoflexia bacterium]
MLKIRRKIAKLKFYILDNLLDFYFQIDTSSNKELIESAGERNGYDPTDWQTFPKLLRLINPGPHDVLLDLGCGKGRILLMASRFSFKRIIGVDYNSELCLIAEKNVKSYSKRSTCKNISVITEDMMKYLIPDDATIMYIYNPLEQNQLKGVMQKIMTSIQKSPRPFKIIFGAPPEFSEEIFKYSNAKKEFYDIGRNSKTYTVFSINS